MVVEGQHVTFAAVVVPTAARRAGVRECYLFLPLPLSTRGCQRFWMCCQR